MSRQPDPVNFECPCPHCGERESLEYPRGFLLWTSKVDCRTCGGQAQTVFAQPWAPPLGALLLGLLPLALGMAALDGWVATLAVALATAVFVSLFRLHAPFRLIAARDSDYPDRPAERDCWTCPDCGTAGPDYLAACWECESLRPEAA